ncbi:unnamed protein product [Phaedon cochleariae]|uniref:Myb-like domain-containing protein n=1 Tax=Phaedon cochleariae TaxID=80249 RepID=A0A9P0GTB8_PHACE|nr:unnamed protein product [Phaedon cochleariae]
MGDSDKIKLPNVDEPNQTMTNKSIADDSEAEDNSEDDGNLEIVVESPIRKRKAPKPTEAERSVIGSYEDDLEQKLGEKAAKMNFNVMHVKKLIRQVVTNEEVLAMVRNAENPSEVELVPSYEPKLTRAKAKELSTSPPVPITWITPEPPAVVQVLVNEELPEDDSSEDEYVPGDVVKALEGEEMEEQSGGEEDHDSSIFSDPPSVEPPTPPMLTLNSDSPRTEWTDDGVFKIPWTKPEKVTTDDATIALRTRSKLCLTSTPLEAIEEAFVPPDIPPPADTDMDICDMECDNEDWMDFLKKFTLPLDEVAKPTEDEEQDPEYNVLADEEIDKVDKEELRVDKAVKVSKRELVDLIAELFDDEDFENEIDKTHDEENEEFHASQTVEVVEGESNVYILIDSKQIPLLQQQMAQHVQMLTQNFILTYKHPELHQLSVKLKEYLLNIKFLGDGKENSFFHAINLSTSLELLDYWEQLWATDSDEVKKMNMHIEQTIARSIHCHRTGTEFIVTFPSLILETISKSSAFVYPSLLPKIPFKTPKIAVKQCTYYTESEDHLISMGLEQFVPIVTREKRFTKNGWSRKTGVPVCDLIHEHMLTYRESRKILVHVNYAKHNRCANNPIKHYFQFGRSLPFTHYVTPLGQLLPPCRRSPEELPHQWKQFIHPKLDISSTNSRPVNAVVPIQIEQYCLPGSGLYPFILPKQLPVYPSTGASSGKRKSPRLAKRRYPNTKLNRNVNVDPITKFVAILSRPSQISKILQLYSPLSTPENSPKKLHSSEKETVKVMNNITVGREDHTSQIPTIFPSMPMLGTPVKNQNDLTTQEVELNLGKRIVNQDPPMMSSKSFHQEEIENEMEICEKPDQSTGCTVNKKSIEETTGKDNVSDLNALMVASSTVKNTIKKEPSGAEKRKMKLKKEYLANITLATPEDAVTEKQKNEDFALAYYDKMREKLEIEDYRKIIVILNDHDKGDAVDLYKKIEVILRPKYVELADEFLLFLRAKEAAAVDRLVPWIRMNNRAKFLKKLEIYFKDQPSQLKKVYTCLTELSQTQNHSSEKIKSSLLPMFKGNSLLSDLFLQNFLDEPPPPSLLEGPYETIDIAKEMSKSMDEEEFETVTVPDVEDKYGGPTCICTCHEIEDPEFQSRYRHCFKCGTKFVNGRVFIQSGKCLRPASVSFLTNPNVDHNIRLMGKSSNVIQKKKRSDSSPSKQTASSSKEIVDDETDDDLDGKRKPKKKPPKRPKKQPEKSPDPAKQPSLPTKPRPRTSSLAKDSKPAAKRKPGAGKKPPDDRKPEKTETETEEERGASSEASKPGATEGQQKRPADDSLEWGEHSTAGESSGEVKPGSPDQQTAESESEFCEESSQDNCESDSNSSVSSFTNQEQSYKLSSSWRREEDKVILEVFQKENDKDNAFRIIAGELKNRTVDEIKSRFNVLMKLLMETIRHN